MGESLRLWVTDNPVRAAVVLVAALGLLIGVVFGIMSVLGGEGGGDDLAVAFPTLTVEESVNQTVEALRPTETPVPTPDVRKTIAAELAATRAARESVVPHNPLGPSRVNEGYALTKEDIEYLEHMGQVVWRAFLAYYELKTVVEDAPSEWASGTHRYSLDLATQMLKEARERDESVELGAEDVADRVRQYARHLRESVNRLKQIVVQLEAATSLVRGSERGWESLSDPDRREVEEVYWSSKDALDEFSSDMAQYGCSICGELFRVDREEN